MYCSSVYCRTTTPLQKHFSTHYNSFYLEGSRSRQCSKKTCQIDPLTEEEQDLLEVDGPCDLASAGFPDWETVKYMGRLIMPELLAIFDRLMCSLFNAKRRTKDSRGSPYYRSMGHWCRIARPCIRHFRRWPALPPYPIPWSAPFAGRYPPCLRQPDKA